MRFCMIGCGWWCDYYARLLKKHARSVDLSFCSRDAAKAKSWCDRFGGKGFYGDCETAAQDNKIDAFLIFTPHHVHLDTVKAFADSRKAILLQKPIAGSLRDAKEIAALCRQRNLKLMVGENFRFHPYVQEVKRILDDRSIGEPIFCRVSVQSPFSPGDWRAEKGKMGGGILVDLGIHYLSVIRHWFGNPSQIVAMAPGTETPEGEGEKAISVTAKMESGVCCALTCAWALDPDIRHKSALDILCKSGDIKIRIEGHLLMMHEGKKRKVRILRGQSTGDVALLREFVRVAAEEVPVGLDYRLGVNDLAFVKAAYRSLEQRAVVDVREFYAEEELSASEYLEDLHTPPRHS